MSKLVIENIDFRFGGGTDRHLRGKGHRGLIRENDWKGQGSLQRILTVKRILDEG